MEGLLEVKNHGIVLNVSLLELGKGVCKQKQNRNVRVKGGNWGVVSCKESLKKEASKVSKHQ